MTEFVNYRVVLDLKDGTLTQGVISHVDRTSITLGNHVITNSAVKDLKVVLLPEKAEKAEKAKKKGAHVEDASSRAATPKVPKLQSNWEAKSDIADIKASEFDFAANLAMFDKKSVFADFQKNDTVSAQDRLVGHNKAPPKDKYDNDEMVIAKKQDNWNNIGAPPKRLVLPAPRAGPAASNNAVLRFVFDNAESVPLASTVQLFEMERQMASFGMDSKAAAEICGANLYQLVVDKILGGSVRLSNRANHNLPPLVVLLLGNSRSSSRALALGRHLANHGVRVLAYVGSAEDDMAAQCELFSKCGGKVVDSSFAELVDILHNQLETPVELIVDALQGFDGLLADLDDATLLSLQQLVLWMNEPKQKSKVLSLDIPSGVDGGSGTVPDALLHVHSRYVASLGLPIAGLLHAYNNGVLQADDVQHFVVDSGIPNALYATRSSFRKFETFWFCAEQYLRVTPTSKAV